MKLIQSIATTVFVTLAMTLTPGCGDAGKNEWEAAGALSGHYDFETHECSMEGPKPNGESIRCFWGYKDFDFAKLSTLPVPQQRFGLHFGGSKLTDSHIEQLARFSKVEYLGLNDTRITGRGLIRLDAFQSLVALDLGRTELGDDDLLAVSKLPKLRVLILSSTNVSDTGAAALRQMKHLEVLDISSTKITDGGLMEIASMPSLKYLGVFKTRASTDGIAAIKSRYPKLEIVDKLE